MLPTCLALYHLGDYMNSTTVLPHNMLTSHFSLGHELYVILCVICFKHILSCIHVCKVTAPTFLDRNISLEFHLS